MHFAVHCFGSLPLLMWVQALPQRTTFAFGAVTSGF
jgi:hypothetical protein